MRLITTSELADKTLPQLLVLYTAISQALYETEPCSVERANMIASLANCARLIAIMRQRATRF